MVTETLFLCGMMMIAFVLGSVSTLIGAWMTRKAYTSEPLIMADIEPEIEEEEEVPETEQERIRREDAEFKAFRGFV